MLALDNKFINKSVKRISNKINFNYQEAVVSSVRGKIKNNTNYYI